MMGRSCCHPKRGLIVLALLLLTCGCSCGGDQEPLFEDDFGNSRSGWGADHREELDRGYEDGEYFFELHEPYWFAWTQAGKKFDDVQVEVDVYLAPGSPDGYFGVLCRHVDVDNFYYFAIGADGYYAIFRREDGRDLEVLTGDGSGMIPSPAIRTGGQTNRIRAVCQGDTLSLYVNGEMLETVTDDAHTQGQVGIGAGSGPESDVRVQFDDFVVTEP
jgi:hypothetical protein